MCRIDGENARSIAIPLDAQGPGSHNSVQHHETVQPRVKSRCTDRSSVINRLGVRRTDSKMLLSIIQSYDFDLAIHLLLFFGTRFCRFVQPLAYYPITEAEWWNHMFKHPESNLVPGWMLFTFCFGAIFCSALIGSGFTSYATRKFCVSSAVHPVVVGICGLATTGFITEILKIVTGRLRPDYVSKCYEKIYRVGANPPVPWEKIMGHAPCQTTYSDFDISDSRKSFPSGHSSYAACAGIISGMFIWDCFKLYRSTAYRSAEDYINLEHAKSTVSVFETISQPRRPAYTGFVLTIGLLFAFALPTSVAISRVVDFRHSPIDVCVGLGVGYFIGYSYYIGYKPVAHQQLTS